mmetsp:Transcript_58627/g.116286  ORF Transcript_58627/g.116286 Transcript_58627/m.116286 type:complete len:565 (-) Transcript_58627:52-1746(-)
MVEATAVYAAVPSCVVPLSTAAAPATPREMAVGDMETSEGDRRRRLLLHIRQRSNCRWTMVSISISMAGLLSAGALALSRWGHTSGINALRRQDFIKEASSNQCSDVGEDCWKTRCCKDPDKTCYAKDNGYAACMLNCMPGINVLELPKYQRPWSCALVKKRSECSEVGHNCTKTQCCQDPHMACYYKDPGWAECKLNCTPGIDRDEPKHLQAPWSCVVPGSNLNIDPAPAEWATSSTTPGPDSAACTRMYGNCREHECCGNTSIPVDCFQRNESWSECREHCPDDRDWACSRESNVTDKAASTTASTSQSLSGGSSTVTGPSPSLYCFSLMMPFGYEVSIIRTQLARGASIFSCNAWDVISNESVMLSPGPPSIIRAQVMPGSMVCKFGGPYNTALNSEIFWRVWVKVFELKRFVEYDWSVKMDPDAVWLPNRLRTHVANRQPASPVYLNNCDEGLHGPIEVISNGGMKSFDLGKQLCHRLLIREWMTYGEDVWVRRCMGLLSVARVDDDMLLREKACNPYKDPMPCNAQVVAFHPLKSPVKYFACLDQANHIQEQDVEAADH